MHPRENWANVEPPREDQETETEGGRSGREERCSRGEFKSNFDVGKSGRYRAEGSDGSLRSFDRELKARSRQFSDATSIVTMGGDGVRSLSFVLSIYLSLSLCPSSSLMLLSPSLFLSMESLARTSAISPPPRPPPPPASVFFRARPSACLSLSLPATSTLRHHPPPPLERAALSRHISLSSAAGSLTCLQHLLALADVKGRAYQ